MQRSALRLGQLGLSLLLLFEMLCVGRGFVVSKELTTLACYNFDTHEPFLIIFAVLVTK